MATQTPELPLECEEVSPETLSAEVLNKANYDCAWVTVYDEDGNQRVLKLATDAMPDGASLFKIAHSQCQNGCCWRKTGGKWRWVCCDTGKPCN